MNNNFKNGLTPEQVEKAEELFRKVNISAICRDLNVKYANIHNVLRDRNNNMADFNKVVLEAQKQVNENLEALEAIPL